MPTNHPRDIFGLMPTFADIMSAKVETYEDDPLDAMREALKYRSDAQPNVTPASPDKPTTLADDAW
jgi:hypothetical protein